MLPGSADPFTTQRHFFPRQSTLNRSMGYNPTELDSSNNKISSSLIFETTKNQRRRQRLTECFEGIGKFCSSNATNKKINTDSPMEELTGCLNSGGSSPPLDKKITTLPDDQIITTINHQRNPSLRQQQKLKHQQQRVIIEEESDRLSSSHLSFYKDKNCGEIVKIYTEKKQQETTTKMEPQQEIRQKNEEKLTTTIHQESSF